MCTGIPMRVISILPGYAKCEGMGETGIGHLLGDLVNREPLRPEHHSAGLIAGEIYVIITDQ
ncbi:MAG: hypothetical protein AB2792_01305 [Candidatus Thiodiazotropha sp.]